MAETMTMSYSYKPVFILAFLDYMNDRGEASLEDVADGFASFYEERIKEGKPAEKKPCIFTKGGYSAKDVERLILSMPFKRFEQMGFMHHSKYLGTIALNRAIMHRLTEDDIHQLSSFCAKAIERYFGVGT